MSGQGVAVLRLTLNGFDAHQNQPRQHSEFGRRPRENQSNGTDHGTVAPHFVAGGRVRGGLYGVPPMLARLDGNGNLPVGVDFRQLYATVLGHGWRLGASAILQQRFEPLALLRT